MQDMEIKDPRLELDRPPFLTDGEYTCKVDEVSCWNSPVDGSPTLSVTLTIEGIKSTQDDSLETGDVRAIVRKGSGMKLSSYKALLANLGSVATGKPFVDLAKGDIIAIREAAEKASGLTVKVKAATKISKKTGNAFTQYAFYEG